VALSAFEADNEVTELSVVQANPWLFGASKVIGRSLAHMRGSKAGLDAINAARVTAAGTGLDRQDPEAFSIWLNEERQRVLGGSGLDRDGQRAFNHAWGERGRNLIDQSVSKNIDANEDQFRAARSADHSALLDSSFATKSYDNLPEEFADRLNSATLLGRDRGVEEAAVLTDFRAHLISNPSAGSGAIQALIKGGVFVSPESKLEAAQLSVFADEQSVKATIAAAKKSEAEATVQLQTTTARWIDAALKQGQPGVSALSGLLLELDPGVADKGRKAFEGALTLADKQRDVVWSESDLIDLDNTILRDPGYDSTALLAEPGITEEAAKRGLATINARDQGHAGVLSFQSVERGAQRLKSQPGATADIAGGAITDPIRVRLFQEALVAHPAAMWEWALGHPDLALNSLEAGKFSDELVAQTIKDIDAIRPPPAPEVQIAPPTDNRDGAAVVQGVTALLRGVESARLRSSQDAVKSGSIDRRNPHADGLYTRNPILSTDGNIDILYSAGAGLPGTFESLPPPGSAAPAATAQPAAAPAQPTAAAPEAAPEPAQPDATADLDVPQWVKDTNETLASIAGAYRGMGERSQKRTESREQFEQRLREEGAALRRRLAQQLLGEGDLSVFGRDTDLP
jgi:hypothetical protein